MADDPRRAGDPGGETRPPSAPEGGAVSATAGWSRVLRLILGWFLFGLGIVGLFVPILQGVLLISLGLLMLSRESPALRRLGRRLGERFPFLRRLHDRLQRRPRAGDPGKPPADDSPSGGRSGDAPDAGE